MKRAHLIGLVLPAILCLLVVAGGAAQPKPEKGAPSPNAPAACAHAHHCPMRQLHELADVKAEKSREGSILSFRAKDPAKLQEVQALVEKLAGCATGEAAKHGKCAECEAHGHMMHRGDGGMK